MLGNQPHQGAIHSFGRTSNISFHTGWKAPRKNLTVTFSFPGEEKGYFVQAVGFTAEDGEQYWAMQEEEFGPIFAEIPAGKYVVVGYFAVCDPEPDEWGQYKEKGSALVVKENVEFSTDTEFTLDGEEAKNFISAIPVGPEGEEYTLTVVKIEADENGDPEIGEEIPGSAEFISQRMGIYSKTKGELFWSQIGMSEHWVSEDFPDYSEQSLFDAGGIYVNDFSDDIIVLGSFEIHPADGVPALTVAMKEGCEPGVLKSSSSDYTYVETKYEQSELGKLQPFPPVETPWAVQSNNYFDGKVAEGMSLSESVDLSLFNYCASAIDAIDYASSTQVWYDDYTSYFGCDTIYEEDFMYVTETRISNNSICPEVYIKDGEKTILNKASDAFYEMKSAPKDPLATVPSIFMYTSSQHMQPYGRTPGFVNVPVASAVSGKRAEIVPFSPSYCGYAGDYVASVNATIDAAPVITYNGKAVEYDSEYYSDFWSGGFLGWCSDWNYENHPAGAYTMSFECPQMIDDIYGKVEYSVSFDQTKKDCVPPVVQYLQFRDKDDNVTCVFEEGLEGDVFIGAGDFAADSEGILESGKEVSVPTVSYAPFGTDDWTVLELEEVAKSSDCFAPIYKISLLQVDKEALDGWFDLKIEMADAEGNTMSQMSSPAFKISELADVHQLREESSKMRIEGRKVYSDNTGIDVFTVYGSKVASINAKSAELSDLPAGVYIIRSGKKSLKTILK